ncbi:MULTISPECIES: hypothetical protein [unclassified Bradyrhizobium]
MLGLDAIGLIQEEVPVAERGFSILVDRKRDGLDVEETPPVPRTSANCLDEGQRIFAVIEPFPTRYHDLPPSSLSLGFGAVAFSLSRSAQRLSILSRILCSNASAEAVDIPAR